MAVVDERLRLIGLEDLRGDRCLGDADHHLRQHQLADHDDRREGRDDDPLRMRGGDVVEPVVRPHPEEPA